MLHTIETFATPFADDDPVIECGARDPEYGDHAEWPAWKNQERWEPTAANVVWLNTNPLPPVAG